MKTYNEFIFEAAGGIKGINKDEWTYGGNGFDSKTATIDRYLATKVADFKAFAWEGLKYRNDYKIEVNGFKFDNIMDVLASNHDADFLAADKEMRRYTKVYSKAYDKGPSFVPKKGQWAMNSKLGEIINYAGTEFAKHKTNWFKQDRSDTRKEFVNIMKRAGHKVDFNHTKEIYTDANVQYAWEVISRAIWRKQN
ncbi:hypothetical protein fHeYen901_135 [Yersinia phage fHe-Yen9-01]|uniref:Uncharacterized protein n=1 Tax=Yersinia phage fHe-Yen9-01 TaxID=1965363 RepID=A0A1V0DXN8_9CAUD|nr:internal virion protein [Yersinia phage fHe-Yen9-01]ARB05908.1 hypothetical protein fHeYen901_135 [Yersinia phage fHe-Yen9-01]